MSQQRKLAAILSADAVGYSRLMADDEAATLRTLNDARSLFRERIHAHGGRLVDTAGDSVLAEFASAVEAVDCAEEIQHELGKRNSQLAEHRRMQFRIGVNLGDVIGQEDGTIYGDGVNIAARLQQLAEPGRICVSGTTFDHVEGKLPLTFEFIGEQSVKNIDKPVRVYRAATRGTTDIRPAQVRLRSRVRLTVYGAAALLLLLIGGLSWQRMRSTPAQDLVLALPKGPSIAVLPFANLTGDPAQEYFSDGITEEIITQLTRFRELFVLARNTTFRYKGQAVDVRKLGQDLGVRYVLEGSVRRDGGRLRVTAQLLDAQTGAHLWGDSFDSPLTATNLLGVQDEITGHVVARIGDVYGVISRTRFKDSQVKTTETLDAYDCLLRAYDMYANMSGELHSRARDCLEGVTAAEPRFADAWAWLSFVYLYEYLFGLNPRPESPLDRALRAAQRAVAADPSSQMGHFALAVAHYHRREHGQFVTQAEEALALNPNNTLVLAELGYRFTQSGQLERGVALTQKAMRLNPQHPAWYYVAPMNGHFLKGEYDQALADALKWASSVPGYWGYANLAAIYGKLGRRADAQAAVDGLLKLDPDFPTKARQQYRIWFLSDRDTEQFLDGLRKAGLEIPPETH